MTTAAETLVALSGLPSGSAATHFLAITAGGGATEYVFGARCVVQVEAAEHRVLRKAKRAAPAAEPTRAPAPQPPKLAKRADVLTRVPSLAVQADLDEAWITTSAARLTLSPTPTPTLHVRRKARY